jgi:HAE1 family hydrophobic/amphiphilic exporter-1
MNLTALFIRRPIMTTLVMLSLLALGISGFQRLPMSDLPNVDFPTLLVTAGLPGASPDTMAAGVATPLERQFSTIAGIASMTSTSTLGSTQITLQFDLDRSLDGAALDVQSMITAAAPYLPTNLPTPPTFRKVNPADQPVLYIALSSATQKLSEVDEFAQTTIAQRISMLSGVAQVQVFGSQKFAVRVQLDPSALASRSIGIDEVATAVQGANVNLPTGTLWGDSRAFVIQATGQLSAAAAYRPVIVAYRNGAPVRLEALGRVIDGVENDKTASFYNGVPAIVLAIQRQPGSNTVRVVDEIRALLPKLRADIPVSVSVDVLYDRSTPIRESVHDVELTMVLTIALVIVVIFVFLRNLAATVIPGVALPLSIVGTFAFMYVLDYSLDNLSLMALTLSVGLVVDDAIVVLENIFRHMEMGKAVRQAALDGAAEISFTVVSMTLSLVAVFLPVLFMGGIIGRLLHEFAVTLAIAILLSGAISLSLTPMLSSRYLRPIRAEHGRLYMAAERAFDGLLRGYERSLRFVLRHRVSTMLVAAAILVATGWLTVKIPKGFLPSEDTGQIFAFTEAAQGTSFEAMAKHQKAVADLVRQNPAIEGVMSSFGASAIGGSANTGRIFMRLVPHGDRPDVDTIINELRPKVLTVPGLNTYIQNLPTLRIGGQLTQALYQLTLTGTDTKKLYPAATLIEGKMRALHGILDVVSDLRVQNPQVDVAIDRDRASSLGVSAQKIESALSQSYATLQVSTILMPTNQYRVFVELLPQYQRDPAILSRLYIRSDQNALVPIDAVVTSTLGVGPLSVNHFGQLPAVTISFNLAPGVSLGEAVTEVEAIASTATSDNISMNFQGTAQAFQSSMKGLLWLVALAVAAIYVVLGILYESFVHPVTILSGLPSAGFGALIALWLFDKPLDVYGFVGVLLLIGIVKKNAIMMIDFALAAERGEHKPPEEAIFEGCIVRFRPIMMTTVAAFVGTLPIAIGFGAGAEARRPLGIAVVGGLLTSQLLTLYITPVVYIYLDRLGSWLSGLRGRPKPA